MKITDIKVIITCPGRNFVTLKIVTDEGVYGIGDATLNGRELAVALADAPEEHLSPESACGAGLLASCSLPELLPVRNEPLDREVRVEVLLEPADLPCGVVGIDRQAEALLLEVQRHSSVENTERAP